MRDTSSGYTFISPILDCEDLNAGTSPTIFFSKTNDFIDSLIKKYSLQTASVYYRDLNNGPWYGYNEKEYFAPASLIKLPIMIAFFKYAEQNPFIFDKEITIKPNEVNNELLQNIKPEKSVGVGMKYSMYDLINYMIQQSDNSALGAITDNFPYEQYLDETFNRVGVDTQIKNGDLVIRTKDYAGFFRVLYNASYISKDMSELALKILSGSSFKDGLVAGIPQDIIVAHKFGERDYSPGGLVSDTSPQDGIKQMHDCGIIYYPGKPYILCVMTIGNDFQKQESFIQDVSKYIYNEVKNPMSTEIN